MPIPPLLHKTAWAFIFGLGFATLSAQAIEKCTGPDGKISFQDQPCAGAGETIIVKPARGAAPPAAAPSPAPSSDDAGASGAAAPAPAAAPTPARKENIYGPRWQRRTYLENRGLPDARDALERHFQACARQQERLAQERKNTTPNLTGATYAQAISGEMQAAATACDTKAQMLQTELDTLAREYRSLLKD